MDFAHTVLVATRPGPADEMAGAAQGLINHTLCPVIAGLLEHGFFHKLWTLNKLTLLGGKDMLASDTFQMVSEGMCIPAFFSQSRVCPH